MSSRRSRMMLRSLSQGELGFLSDLRPKEVPLRFFVKPSSLVRPPPMIKPAPKSAVKDSKPPQRKESIFTFGSPEREKPSKEVGFGEFLNACSLCKKNLNHCSDLYLYGYLSAFCSPECRDDQMDLDGFHQQIAKETAIRIAEFKKNKLMHGFTSKTQFKFCH